MVYVGDVMQGIRGLPGIKGDDGPPGSQGPPGSTGTRGLVGPKGHPVSQSVLFREQLSLLLFYLTIIYGYLLLYVFPFSINFSTSFPLLFHHFNCLFLNFFNPLLHFFIYNEQ